MNRREPTQAAKPGWPFLYSVVPGRGVVKNVAKEPRARVKIVTQEPKARVRIHPQVAWPFGPAAEKQAPAKKMAKASRPYPKHAEPAPF